MTRRRWSAIIPVVALVAMGSLVVLQRVGEDHSVVRVRPQSARESFILRGHGTPAPPTAGELEDLTRLAHDTGQKVADVVAENVGQAEFHAAVDRLTSSYVISGHAGSGAGYRFWVLFTAKPTDAELAPLTHLPVDVQVRYGDTISTYASESLGATMIGERGKHLTVRAIETSFDDDYDAVAVTYRPPAGADAADLASAEHAALADLAAAEPDGMLPFPVEFVRDPTLRSRRGDSQVG
jgi:hypothetical protein